MLEKLFSLTKSFVLNCKKKMASKELFSQLSLWMVNINLTVYISPYIYMCPQSSWIRIQYGSGSQHWHKLCVDFLLVTLVAHHLQVGSVGADSRRWDLPKGGSCSYQLGGKLLGENSKTFQQEEGKLSVSESMFLVSWNLEAAIQTWIFHIWDQKDGWISRGDSNYSK